MRRLISSLVALALAGVGLASGGAGAASRCDPHVVVFSRSSDNVIGSVNWNGVVCIPSAFAPETAAVADGPIDFRLINPGSDLIAVRYTEDVRFDPPMIKAKLNGLGFDDHVVSLPLQNIALPGEEPVWAYESGDISIDPAASGCLNVKVSYTHKKKRADGTIKRIKVLNERTQYHTYDAAC